MRTLVSTLACFGLLTTGIFADQTGSIPLNLGKPTRLKGKLDTAVTFQEDGGNLVAQIRIDNSHSPALYWGLKLGLLKKDGTPCDPKSRSMTFMPEKPVAKGQFVEQKMIWSLQNFKPSDVGKVELQYVESSKPLPDNAIH